MPLSSTLSKFCAGGSASPRRISMRDGTQNYAVGYGKPPVHGRFAKGRSGNPGGRPRGKSLTTLLREAFDQPGISDLDGKRRRVSKGKAIVSGLVDGAVAADPRASRLLFQLMMKLETGGRGLRWKDEEEEDDDGEDPREFLIRELDRLAALHTNENSKALGRLAAEEAVARSRAAVAAG